MSIQTIDAINRVFHGSTDHVTEGYGAYSSRSVVMGGNAIVAAAEKLRQSMRAVAAQKFGCAANEIEMDSGMVFGPDRQSLPLAAFAGEPHERRLLQIIGRAQHELRLLALRRGPARYVEIGQRKIGL